VRALYRRKSEDLGRELKMPEVVFLTAYVSQHFTKHLKDMGQEQIYEKPLHDSQLFQIFSNASARITGQTQTTQEEAKAQEP
jgi:AmiR/NasT family two-component response regulator